MRILVLYPGLYAERRELMAPHRWRLRLSGTRLILADDCVHPDDAKAFEDVLQLPSPDRAEEVWQVLARYLERHPVDGIVAQSETSLLLGARVAREFGLIGPAVEAVMATVSKFETRTRLARAGVVQPAFRLVSSANEVRAFGREQGWPVVLKAGASSRQRLVTRVAGELDVEQAVARMQAALPGARDVLRLASFAELEGLDLGFDPTREFLVEAFQEGLPLECDAILKGQEARWFGVCEQLPSLDQRFFIDGYLLPGRLDRVASQRVLAAAQASVQVLGLSDTGVSVEMRLDQGAPSIIEVNGRLPWDEGLQELIQASTGSLPAELALRVAMGRKLPRAPKALHAALLYRSHYHAGRVASLPGKECMKRISKAAHGAWVYVRSGESLLHADHPDSHPHLGAIMCRNSHSTERALAQCEGLLEELLIGVRVPEMDNMIPAPSVQPLQALPLD